MLIDIRHSPQPIDLEFMQWLGINQIPFAMIFTKADKLKPKAIEEHISQYELKMLEAWEEMPTYFITSSTKRIGKEELLNYIHTINQSLTN